MEYYEVYAKVCVDDAWRHKPLEAFPVLIVLSILGEILGEKSIGRGMSQTSRSETPPITLWGGRYSALPDPGTVQRRESRIIN